MLTVEETKMGSGWRTETMEAAEAAARLGVKPATLYTYVSRGWLSSLPGSDGRTRRYLTEEVEHLRERAEAMRGHRAVAASAIRWGQPIIDTAISDVSTRGPRYRGTPARALVPRGFSAVAEHLIGLPPAPWPPADTLPGIDLAVDAADGAAAGLHRRLIGLMSRCETDDPRAILQLIAVACAQGAAAARAAAAQRHPSQILAVGLGCARPEAVDAAMGLCADHELNASTFAARVAASTGAAAAVCICAALAALSGPRHGSLSEQVEELLDGGAALGDGVPPGCGHRLYPEGDPRAALLIALQPVTPEVRALLDEIDARGLPPPSLDLGLVALRRALGLPRGSAMAIFAAGRAAGWLAHIAEEHARGQLIRPRARYTGRRG